MTSRPVIAIDIDDVLAVENEAVRQFANARYGHAHTAADYLVPGEYWGYWEGVQQVDADEGRRRYAEYLASGIKARMQVMDGAQRTLGELRRRYDLVVVTSRDPLLVDITHAWLERHFPAHFRDIAFVAMKTGDVKGSKAVVCRELGATYLIDDHPGHLKAAHDMGVEGILFGHYGWSASVPLPETTRRARDWREVRGHFGE